MLDVPDDLGLQLRAVPGQQRRLLRRVLGRAQGGERRRRRGQVGCGLLDVHAEFAEPGGRPPADGRDLRIDRGDAAQIGREGHAPQVRPSLDRRRVGDGRRIVEQRVARVVAGQRVQEQGGVADVAGHGPLDAQGREGQAARPLRHPTGRGAQAHDAAEGGRRAQRSPEVGAVREPRHAGRQRHRRPARGAAAGEVPVPWVAGDAEHLVEGVGPGAELRRVGLAQHDPRPRPRSAGPARPRIPAPGRRRSASRRSCARPPPRPGP